MGFFKKVFKPIRKVAKKIIPKEIRPFLPYIAAAFGPAGLAGTKFATMNPAFQKAILAGVTSAATDEQGDPLRAAALAAAPDVLSQGLGNVAGRIDPNLISDSDSFVQISDSAAKAAGALSRAGKAIEGAGTFKTIGAQTAIDQSAKLAEIQQDEIDQYNENLRKQGVLDKTKRRSAIANIYINAGYETDYVNSMLDRYGYESGGITNLRAGYKNGKRVTTMKDLIGEVNDNDDDDDFNDFLMKAKEGVEMAYQTPGPKPVPMLKFAQGGEVEEEVEESGIMMASAPGPKDGYDDIARELFGKGYKDLTPEEMEIMQEELERLMNKFRSSADDEGIMQMASGYKTDIEEMYEQYVFEMEEQGLEPMSFAQFLAQARAGMADGGEVSINQIEMLIRRGADNDLIKTYVEGAQDGVIDQIREAMKKRENKKDGGKAKRRKKGQEDDSDGEKPGPRKFPKLEDKMLYEEKMPQVMPGNKPDMMDAAMGGIASMADGGIMEKDMRGGGFIPEGSKERADDVPARLSKNEFVMTADAVRAAGGGSVNKGAKRMYDMMYSLEGKI